MTVISAGLAGIRELYLLVNLLSLRGVAYLIGIGTIAYILFFLKRTELVETYFLD